jgi:hypothetical protein
MLILVPEPIEFSLRNDQVLTKINLTKLVKNFAQDLLLSLKFISHPGITMFLLKLILRHSNGNRTERL